MAGDIDQINNRNSPTQIGDGNTQNIENNKTYNNCTFNKVKSEPPPKQLTSRAPLKSKIVVGREADLEELERLLVENRQVVLVNGLGGVGKTTLCREYYWNHYKNYDHLAWIDYRGSIKDSFSLQFGRMAGFIEDDSIDTRFDKIVALLCRPELENTLLILDNIDRLDDPDIDTIRSLPLKVIAASRLQIKGFPRHQLGLLPLDECKKLFTKHYECQDDEDHLEKIINLAGRHTLTVELLANTAKNSCTELKEFYSQLLEIGFNLDETIKEHTTSEWHAHEEDTFFNQLLKVFELSGINDDELYILTNLSILPNLHIEVKNVKEWLGLESLNDLNSLVSKGWLLKEEKSRTVYMHPVIGEVVRYRTEPDVEKCGQLLKNICSNLSYKPEDIPLTRKWLIPYSESILSCLQENNIDFSIIFNWLSLIFKAIGNYDKALKFQLKALSILETFFGKENLDLANSYSNLAMIYKAMGQFKQAFTYQFKAIHIQKKTFPKEHLSLSTSYNNLSMIYCDMKMLEEAMDYQLKSINILENLHKKEHPDLARSYNNLARVLQYTGNLKDAIDFQLKALTIQEKLLNKEHPDLACSYNNLAMLYYEIGNLKKALEYQLKTLTIIENQLKDHPHLASSYNNLSIIYQAMGHLEKALDSQLKALFIRQKILSEEHFDLACSYSNIAMIHCDMGNFEKALEYQSKAITIQKNILGDKHADLADSCNNMTGIYKSMGLLEDALEYQLRAVSIGESVLNVEHTDLASYYNNLATTYAGMNEFTNALFYGKKAIAIMEKNFPEGHYGLTTFKANLEHYKKGITNNISTTTKRNRTKRNRKKKR